MPRKIIIDCDPGIDDAMALTMALFHPDLEVVAVTSVGGNAPIETTSRNVRALIEYLDPSRWPRIGFGTPADSPLPVEGRHSGGIDGMGTLQLPVAELLSSHPAEKVIVDTVRDAPGEVTIVALGPLTNVARAFHRDPELPGMLQELVIVGGAVESSGNVTPAAEFNIYCDPLSAAAVFLAPCRKRMIPLDVTNRVMLTLDMFDGMPDETSRAGRLLRSSLLPAFRDYRQRYGFEGLHIHDTVGMISLVSPSHFQFEKLAGVVETEGRFAAGMTLFDRRRIPSWRPNLSVALEVDHEAVLREVLELAHAAGRATKE